MIKVLGPMLIAFLLVVCITPFVKKLAKIVALDKPNERKVHKSLMPRMGGLAICLGFWLTVLLTQDLTKEIFGLLAGGIVIAFVGILDDTKGVSPKMKLLAQGIAACIVLFSGVKVQFLTHPIEGVIPLGFLSYPLTFLWIVGITNAVNLIDGLDGLAAGISAIAALTLGMVSWLAGYGQIAIYAFILASSILGFLKYNFHPAQIFMGDTGALFLGFNLSTLAILGLTKSTTVISLFLPIIILGVPILDTMLAIFRRYSKGKPIFSADKEHIHHRLLGLGLSHGKTVLAMYGVSILLGISAILMSIASTAQGMLIMVGVTMAVFIAAEKVGVIRPINSSNKNAKSQDVVKDAAK